MTAPTPSPFPEIDLDDDLEFEDNEVVEDEDEDEEQEEEEEEEVDEDEAEGEEEEEEMATKDTEYEYPIDSGPYQTSDYLDTFYYEKSQKPTTSSPLMKGDSCKCASLFLFIFLLLRERKNIMPRSWFSNCCYQKCQLGSLPFPDTYGLTSAPHAWM